MVGAKPRLTVVTPSFNQGQYLSATIESVLGQGYPNLDYLVIDGGSMDASVDVIRRFSSQLEFWVSERDEGQAHAIEKGLARATGEWFVWINSDDLLAPGALSKVAALATDDTDMIAGACRHFDGEQTLKTYLPRRITAENIVWELFRPGTRWQQPSTWFRTDALRQVGLNRALHFAFDYDLMIRYLAHFPRVAYTDETLACFRLHPESKTARSAQQFLEEQVRTYHRLQHDPALAALHPSLGEVLRKIDWMGFVDGLLRDRDRSRLERARELLGVMRRGEGPFDRAALRTLRRLFLYGGYRPGTEP